MAYTLTNLGDTLRALGRSAEALDHINRGVEILGRTFGNSHPRLIPLLVNRAEILNQLRRHVEARRDAERAVAIQDSEAGSHTDLVYALEPLGDALLGLGQPAAAEGPIRRGIRLADEGHLDEELSRLRLALARALWDSGRDRRGARALATRVATGSKAAKAGKSDQALRAQAVAWLAAHRG